MDILKNKYSITELSERLNVTDHTLRYYEKEFNLNIPKDERGRRYYAPEMANLMFQIKNMRDEGLEIKAIKKILISENMIIDPAPVTIEENSVAVISTIKSSMYNANELKEYFDKFKEDLTSSVTTEVAATRDQLSKELTKTKLELGACVENGMRKLEAKMEKHFVEVDRSLSTWRERRNKNLLNRLLTRFSSNTHI